MRVNFGCPLTDDLAVVIELDDDELVVSPRLAPPRAVVALLLLDVDTLFARMPHRVGAVGALLLLDVGTLFAQALYRVSAVLLLRKENVPWLPEHGAGAQGAHLE